MVFKAVYYSWSTCKVASCSSGVFVAKSIIKNV
jgi:hypothetical protein